MLKPIAKSDVNIRPFKVYKSWIFDQNSIKINTVHNLSGSFDSYASTLTTGSGYSFNEYALNKSIRVLYYNTPQLIGSVTNWSLPKHSSRQQYLYQVTSSAGLVSYSYYYNTASLSYVDEFQNYLNTNEYIVNSSGQVLSGTHIGVNQIYGSMINYASTTERLIGNRFFVAQIPQINIGEGIQPGSFQIVDSSTGRTLIDDSNGNLTYSTSTGSIVGNVFYSNGIATVTYKTDTPTDENYNFATSSYTISFKSTKTIYENEVFIEVLPNEFNVSTNPTAIVNYNGVPYVKSRITVDGTNDTLYDFRIASSHTFNYATIYGPSGSSHSNAVGFSDYLYSSSVDPTGSYLSPYITTIGLYDSEYNLVAVAKVPAKPKSMPDYPINFIIRFDT